MMIDETQAASINERDMMIASGAYALESGRLYDIEIRKNVASGRYSVKVANEQIEAFHRILAEFEPVGMTPREARKWVGVLAEYRGYTFGRADAMRAA